MQQRSRDEIVANLGICYDAVDELMGALAAENWGVQSLCPEWSVREVVAHLASVEQAILGWRPTSADDALPFETIGPWTSEAMAWSNERLVTEARALFAARRAELDELDDEQFAVTCPTPVGPATYGRFMDVRVFDFWVHERDITTPLGRATDDGGPAAESATDEVALSIGYIVGKKIGLPDGMSIAFHLTGPVTRSIYAAVDGRAGRVDHIDDPSVEVSVDSLTFVQLACGRIDPQGPIEAGRITWTGDGEWGERAARNLAFTM
ncbi:MAG: maleylpyruvate isomerase family mycothiol-dependent enzyme [Actinomycetota bacterium]